ncbi:CLUMA_CG005839, isoform A [Clunio marinus]|uniref:CLUMA_CG005839, isoform A n=1 Tax=Clunio marinus TaxID=568069 RepID=A0A1J1I029_9DIPT|nr:CLUMA_CG005839, isoform A [Clunio marinus]
MFSEIIETPKFAYKFGIKKSSELPLETVEKILLARILKLLVKIEKLIQVSIVEKKVFKLEEKS